MSLEIYPPSPEDLAEIYIRERNRFSGSSSLGSSRRRINSNSWFQYVGFLKKHDIDDPYTYVSVIFDSWNSGSCPQPDFIFSERGLRHFYQHRDVVRMLIENAVRRQIDHFDRLVADTFLRFNFDRRGAALFVLRAPSSQISALLRLIFAAEKNLDLSDLEPYFDVARDEFWRYPSFYIEIFREKLEPIEHILRREGSSAEVVDY